MRLNVRTYGEPTRHRGLAAFRRIITAECQASGCPSDPDFRVAQEVPVNHAPGFAPVIQPTCDTGTQALVVATLAWLGT